MTRLCFLLLGVLVGVSLCQDTLQGSPSAQNSNFALAVSNELIADVLDTILPPVVYAGLSVLGPQLPQSCCYGTQGDKELYLNNMAIPPSSISTSVSVSDGPKFDIDIDFDVTLYYKWCKAGLLACTTIFPCEGDATLGMKTKTKFDLELIAGANGGPEFTFKKFDFHLDISKKGVCFLLEGLLDTFMPFINIFLNAFLPHILGPLIHDISLPHNFTVPGPLPMNLDWTLTQGTGSNSSGLSFQGVLDILLKSTNYQKAPYTPTQPLPLAVDSIKDGVNTFDITDSFLNNILFTAYHHFQDFEFDTEQDGFKIKFSLPEQPIVNFTSASGNQAGILSLYTHVSLTKIPLKIAITSIETAHFALLFNSQGQLYLSLDPNDFVVDITSMTPPQPNATRNAIQNQIEAAWEAFVPALDETLAAHPISIPIPGAQSPSINYFNGYARLQFTTKDESVRSREEPNANVIDFAGPFKKSLDALSPALSRVFAIVWESAHSLNPEEELLPFVHTGLPAGQVLGCPNIPLFGSCWPQFLGGLINHILKTKKKKKKKKKKKTKKRKTKQHQAHFGFSAGGKTLRG